MHCYDNIFDQNWSSILIMVADGSTDVMVGVALTTEDVLPALHY